MGKGEINGRAGVHHNDTDGEQWELHVGQHEVFTRTEMESLADNANTSKAAFLSRLATLKPNWDLSSAEETGAYEAAKRLYPFSP